MKVYYIDRKVQIKHFTDLSILENLKEESKLSLSIPASENFIIQLAAVPERETELTRTDIKGNGKIYCLNTQITDKFGKSCTKSVPLKANVIQPLFFVVPMDESRAGKNECVKITLVTDLGEKEIEFDISYNSEPVENGGYNDLWRMSRLNWLNSKRFLNSEVVAPYINPQVDDKTVRILGRDITFGNIGLPSQVFYYFDEGICLKDTVQNKLLSLPMEFKFGGENVNFSECKLVCDEGRVYISALGTGESFGLEVKGTLYYEGFIDYKVRITAKKDFSVPNVSLEATLDNSCAVYMNGLGAVGGKARSLSFKWTDEKHLDCLYVGAVNAGVRFKWKSENYVKPLINIYYKNQPLKVPEETWDNHGSGEILFEQSEEASRVVAQTHTFSMKEGEVRSFDFELHFTPFKPIDYKKHYSVRYYHRYKFRNEFRELRKARRKNLTHFNIHHGNGPHPFINYPFIEVERLKECVDYGKKKNIGVKVYYTTREHSNHMAEVFAYKALGNEIIMRKHGTGFQWQDGTDKWLTEYFGADIIPAWREKFYYGKYKHDADVSFIVQPNSRLDNYYVEGLDWLVKNIGISGIYIDDTAMDRTTIERARKVLSSVNGLIDMHMWNHENECAGDVSCMNLYTELFPFIDSLWIGEGYPYKQLTPEYLLTEVSGIPYGQTSEMLEGGGDPYIGMLFSMNNRYGWGVKNAHRIYRIWDDFGIQDSEMRGFWHSKNPVKITDDDVKATVYIKNDSALVCVFNFSESDKNVKMEVDEKLLGFAPSTAKTVNVKKLLGRKMDLNGKLNFKGKSGIMFLLKK